MRFYGVDLAWSSNNMTGVTCIDEKKVVFVKQITFLEDIVELIPKNSYVGIDAPLVVVNQTGSRESEKLLNKEYAQYQAGAYYVNRNLLGENRGEKLCLSLKEYNCVVEEVFPHVAHIELFELQKTLKYKSRFPREVRIKEFERYRDLLKNEILLPEELLTDISGFKGKELKSFEDKLDAITCALVMKYYYYYPQYCSKYGEILVPKKLLIKE